MLQLRNKNLAHRVHRGMCARFLSRRVRFCNTAIIPPNYPQQFVCTLASLIIIVLFCVVRVGGYRSWIDKYCRCDANYNRVTRSTCWSFFSSLQKHERFVCYSDYLKKKKKNSALIVIWLPEEKSFLIDTSTALNWFWSIFTVRKACKLLYLLWFRLNILNIFKRFEQKISKF